ncbi:hypothetical protein R6Q59_013713 [Mikania micrantha]
MVAYRVINEGRRNRLKLLQRVNRQQAGVEIVESSSSFGLDAQTEMCVAEERNCRGGYVYGCQCTAARDEGGRRKNVNRVVIREFFMMNSMI